MKDLPRVYDPKKVNLIPDELATYPEEHHNIATKHDHMTRQYHLSCLYKNN
jgi:hypothetical protein